MINNLFSVTAPVTIKYPDGQKMLVIEKYPHKQGLIIFEPFWHLHELTEKVHLVQGELEGDGPWKINQHIITVTGCQGSDPDMATLLTDWQAYLSTPDVTYPTQEEIDYLASRLGAIE